MRDEEAPGPLTPASAPKAPGRLGREDARNFGSASVNLVLFERLHHTLELIAVDRLEAALRFAKQQHAIGVGDVLHEVVGNAYELECVVHPEAALDPRLIDQS